MWAEHGQPEQARAPDPLEHHGGWAGGQRPGHWGSQGKQLSAWCTQYFCIHTLVDTWGFLGVSYVHPYVINKIHFLRLP